MRRATFLFVAAVGLVLAARPARAQSVLPRAGWVATGSPTGGGSSAAGAIDGSASTGWTTGTSQTSGQWFSLDMITPQTNSQVTLAPAS